MMKNHRYEPETKVKVSNHETTAEQLKVTYWVEVPIQDL